MWLNWLERTLGPRDRDAEIATPARDRARVALDAEKTPQAAEFAAWCDCAPDTVPVDDGAPQESRL
jgi:hypothetical protein